MSRLRDAHDALDHDGVYIAFTEATNWLHSLDVSGNEDIDALIFARNRSHHHAGSLSYPDEGDRVYRWRPASQLPVPPDPEIGTRNARRSTWRDSPAGRSWKSSGVSTPAVRSEV